VQRWLEQRGEQPVEKVPGKEELDLVWRTSCRAQRWIRVGQCPAVRIEVGGVRIRARWQHISRTGLRVKQVETMLVVNGSSDKSTTGPRE
jgi:hypothetical protein